MNINSQSVNSFKMCEKIILIIFYCSHISYNKFIICFLGVCVIANIFTDISSDEESESSIDVVEGHEVVLKTSSEKSTSDDPDYLQLLEAHQQRLDETSSPGRQPLKISILVFNYQ